MTTFLFIHLPDINICEKDTIYTCWEKQKETNFLFRALTQQQAKTHTHTHTTRAEYFATTNTERIIIHLNPYNRRTKNRLQLRIVVVLVLSTTRRGEQQNPNKCSLLYGSDTSEKTHCTSRVISNNKHRKWSHPFLTPLRYNRKTNHTTARAEYNNVSNTKQHH